MLTRFALLLVLTSTAAASAQTFSDETFDPGDWTLQVEGSGTVDAMQQLAGGKARDHLRDQHHER